MPWIVLAIVALFWPSHLSAVVDGMPFDRMPEAIAFGVFLPVLVWMHPGFLRKRGPRIAVAILAAIKIASSLTLAQDGFCVTFEPEKVIVFDSRGKPHSWDARADWLADDPQCSAIMTRSYFETGDLPVWFFNLPPPNDTPSRNGYHPGTYKIRVRAHGFITVRDAGTFRVDSLPAMSPRLAIDGSSLSSTLSATLSPGTHLIDFEGWLDGKLWRIVPQWNNTALGSMRFPMATQMRPSAVDRVVRPYGNWFVLALTALLLLWWSAAAVARVQDNEVRIWCLAATIAIATFSVTAGTEQSWLPLSLATLALFVPVRPRLQNMRGAFLLIGVPWLAFVAAANADQIGRWTLYGVGNDNFIFQRYSYRIFLQGYWLEGGQPTFWKQPFFPWIAGALHMLFGDSSVGQVYWDGCWVLVIAFFAYQVTRHFAGYRWGLAGALPVLAMFLLGPSLEFVGFGLSEISSAGFIYLAAFFAMRARARNRLADAIVAGVLAVLGFITRLNNFPMAVAVATLALPLETPAGLWYRPAKWWPDIRWKVCLGIWGSLAGGLLLLAWRTWHFTGVFSPFYGTQRDFLAVWKPGMSAADAVPAMISSVMMIITASDPPRFAWHALPIILASVIVVAAIAGMRPFRNLPLPLAAMFVAGLSGALLVRGWGHDGRFSIHLFGIASAIVAWTVQRLLRRPAAVR